MCSSRREALTIVLKYRRRVLFSGLLMFPAPCYVGYLTGMAILHTWHVFMQILCPLRRPTLPDAFLHSAYTVQNPARMTPRRASLPLYPRPPPPTSSEKAKTTERMTRNEARIGGSHATLNCTLGLIKLGPPRTPLAL
ncbi:hypothetical protein PLICRDRAFT_454403 [Plicaturopsis crispa FD-325 SS-3]|uniref:Uncharacterized protein n=1 Tax=Plicaturopsis crispa FD-325 SS-3 TaxID=944288 RepID=A0A0C9T254_PLICR|nr:hypothetical protein PLICRDRAFT_454403 [Plicaturopsis crispa FD-325 SS-3]